MAEEVTNLNEEPSLPEFESYPETAKEPEKTETDTISEVNQDKTTNQAPESSSSLQPSGQTPQNANNSLQTSSALNNGSQSEDSNVLNQGLTSDSPLSVGVASSSTASSIPALDTPSVNNQSYMGTIWLIVALLAAASLILFFNNKKLVAQKVKVDDEPNKNIEAPDAVVASSSIATEKPKTKAKTKKKIKNGRKAR